MKRFLFVLRRSPFLGSMILETLDMLMTVAAFDQAVEVLFLDDGVFLLKQHQQPEILGLRPSAPLLQALEIYGVDRYWVEAESLVERNLAPSDLILPTLPVARSDVAGLLAQAEIVVSG